MCGTANHAVVCKSFEWHNGHTLVAKVVYEGEWPCAKLISFITYSNEEFDWPLWVQDDAHLNRLFESRQAPRKNFTQEASLFFGLKHYHVEKMCRFTHGAMPHDLYWMKFEADSVDLTWRDVAVGNYYEEEF